MFFSVLMTSFTCIILRKERSPFHIGEGVVLCFSPQTSIKQLRIVRYFPLRKTGMRRRQESPGFDLICTSGFTQSERLLNCLLVANLDGVVVSVPLVGGGGGGGGSVPGQVAMQLTSLRALSSQLQLY